MDDISEKLGALFPLYQEYKAIKSGSIDDEEVRGEYRPEVVADRLDKLRDKIHFNISYGELQVLKDKALHYSVSDFEARLRTAHFVGSICQFFDEVAEYETAAEENLVAMSQIEVTAGIYSRIPEERRKGASLTAESTGYYWGGHAVKLDD